MSLMSDREKPLSSIFPEKQFLNISLFVSGVDLTDVLGIEVALSQYNLNNDSKISAANILDRVSRSAVCV